MKLYLVRMSICMVMCTASMLSAIQDSAQAIPGSQALISAQDLALSRMPHQYTEQEGWKKIEDYFTYGNPSDAESRSDINAIFSQHTSLRGTCALHMARQLEDFWREDLWMLNDCIQYCREHNKQTIEQLIRTCNKNAIIETLGEFQENSTTSEHNDIIESLRTHLESIFNQPEQQQEEAASTVTTPNTIRTLIKQASYGKISYPKK